MDINTAVEDVCKEVGARFYGRREGASEDLLKR